ncbi:hypothetical protein BHF02_01025 [Escherichia coli]|nr:hypothetical protein BHF02_01025 [Escherichia coli]OJO84429.1 hypothetical protein BK329_21440 [Escherichia coli]
MSQYPTADSVIELLNIIAMAVTDIGIAVTTAIIQRGGNDSNLLIVFYVQIMPDDFVMQLHRF